MFICLYLHFHILLGEFPFNNFIQIFWAAIEHFQKRIKILKFQFKNPVKIWLGLR